MATRDYKREYALHQSSPKDIAQRSARNKARRVVKKSVGEAAIRGKDIDHKRPLSKGGSNSPCNLRIRSVRANRGDKSMMRKKLG